jgi:hypothetical protein
MKVRYIGANCRVGVSEKTGRPYTIAELTYSVPDQNAVRNNDDGTPRWKYVAHGHRVQTIALDPTVVSKFQPCVPGEEIEVRVEPQPDNPTRTHVVGLA